MKQISSALIIFPSIVSSVQSEISPDEALSRLIEGNKRFTQGKSIHPNQTPEKIKELSAGQKPFAVIVGCSDSRVPNEIIFDQGLGDLFILKQERCKYCLIIS